MEVEKDQERGLEEQWWPPELKSGVRHLDLMWRRSGGIEGCPRRVR